MFRRILIAACAVLLCQCGSGNKRGDDSSLSDLDVPQEDAALEPADQSQDQQGKSDLAKDAFDADDINPSPDLLDEDSKSGSTQKSGAGESQSDIPPPADIGPEVKVVGL